MNTHAYGTVEYYRDYFADIIADVAQYDDIERNRVTMANIMDGFREAVQEWMVYHDTSAASYRELMEMFNKSHHDTPEQLAKEEEDLPEQGRPGLADREVPEAAEGQERQGQEYSGAREAVQGVRRLPPIPRPAGQGPGGERGAA